MLTTFTYLPNEQVAQLAELVLRIVKTISPGKIICYGHRRSVTQCWSCFRDEQGFNEIPISTFDLLILTGEDEKRQDHEIVQKIEQQAEELDCHVTSLVHKISSVNELLEKGSRFFSTLYRKGVLLYNGSDLSLSPPPDEPIFSTLKIRIEKDWEQSFEIAKRFFKSATDCLDMGWPEHAMFNLHQTVQHTCMAVIRAFSGYRSTTHNLSRLLALIENFICDFIVVFPCVTNEEEELFNLLNKAYSNARYNECYVVPPDKALIVKKRVTDFLMIAEHVYKKRLIALENSQPISFPVSNTTN